MGEVSAWFGDLKSGRTVVEFCDDLYGPWKLKWFLFLSCVIKVG